MTNPKKHKKLAITSLALAVAVFGSAFAVGSAFADTTNASDTKAAAVASAAPTIAGKDANRTGTRTEKTGKGGGQHRGGGHLRAVWSSAELAKLLGLPEDELKAQLKAGKSLADIAGVQGVDTQKVQDLLLASLTEQLDSRLADGKITQAQYDAHKAKLADRAADALTRVYSGKGGDLRGHGGRGGGFASGIRLKDNADIAALFGLTTEELSAQLKAGKSLSALAGEHGVSAGTVTAKVEALLAAALDQRLADGKITQAQYDAHKAKLADRAAALTSRALGGHDGAPGGSGKDRRAKPAATAAGSADTAASAAATPSTAG
ncbi:SHOCT domain-containing protein [Cohnella sp. 56]|uniref:SHOCT domain-containing protein n=1 Tax=Cohnella sp. 56 TaxID=3113722 RepID=UPI0030EAC680